MKRYMACSVVLIMLLSSMVVFAKDQQKNRGKLAGKKIVMVIAQRNFERPEYEYSREIFEREGADIIVASSNLSAATSAPYLALTQLKVKPDILIKDIQVKDYDAVVFIGGIGCMEYFDDPIAHNSARQAVEQGKIVAAICGAPVILANAGLLNGKKATTSRSYNIKEKGAIYTGNTVERDGNIITANGPSASKEFGEAIASALSE